MVLIAKDVAIHHVLRQSLIHELRNQNSEVVASDIALSLWPIAGGRVIAHDVQVRKGKIAIDIEQINFRIPLFGLRTVRLSSQNIAVMPSLQSQQFLGEVVIGRTELTLTAGQFIHAALNADADAITAPSIGIDGEYVYQAKALSLNVNIPNISFNESSGMALTSHAKLTLDRPVIGNVDLRVRGFKQLLKALVTGRYLREKDLPMLMFGAQLLGGKSQEIPVTLNFSAAGVFLGPIRIAAALN